MEGPARAPGYGIPPIADQDRFDEKKSRAWAAAFNDAATKNLNDSDLAIIAHRLGINGVKQWAEQGRPDNEFGRTAMGYLQKVKAAMPISGVAASLEQNPIPSAEDKP